MVLLRFSDFRPMHCWSILSCNGVLSTKARRPMPTQPTGVLQCTREVDEEACNASEADRAQDNCSRWPSNHQMVKKCQEAKRSHKQLVTKLDHQLQPLQIVLLGAVKPRKKCPGKRRRDNRF